MERRFSPDIAHEAKPASAPAAAPAAKPADALSERIRVRAYEISLVRRGRPDALADWLQAEAEVLAKQPRSLT